MCEEITNNQPQYAAGNKVVVVSNRTGHSFEANTILVLREKVRDDMWKASVACGDKRLLGHKLISERDFRLADVCSCVNTATAPVQTEDDCGMKLTCLSCGHKFIGYISHDELGWHSVCPVCGSSFDVDVPEGRIVMAFAWDMTHEFFSDWHDGNGIISYYAFDTPQEFIEAWEKMSEEPDGMWYWCLDNGRCFCYGACDPNDIDIFEEHFGDELAEVHAE